MLNALASALNTSILSRRIKKLYQTPSIHCLQRGLHGYLIRFAPHAFEPERQNRTSESPSPLVFLPISTHLTATPGILLTPSCLNSGSFERIPSVERRSLTQDLPKRLRISLHPITPGNVCALRVTDASGT